MAESREKHRQEAIRLWKLGDFPNAHIQFNKAAEEHDDLKLAVDVAAMLLTQGCAKRSAEKIDQALNMFGNTKSEPAVLALAAILQALTTAITTIHFSGPLKD